MRFPEEYVFSIMDSLVITSKILDPCFRNDDYRPMNENVILVKLVLDNDRGTGIQAPSLRIQGTIKNWIPAGVHPDENRGRNDRK
jgi:hypothetical protein